MPAFGLFVLSSRHSPRFRMAPESQDFHKLTLLGGGRGYLDLEDDEVALQEGDLLWVPARTRHRFRDDPDDPMTLHIACLTPPLPRSAPWLAAAWQDVTTTLGRTRAGPVTDPYQLGQLTRRFRAMVFEQTQGRPYADLALLGDLAHLLAAARRALDGGTRRTRTGARDARDRSAAFRGTVSFIDNHFHEPLRIDELAAQAQMSYRTYTAHFKRATGQTVATYIARKRTRYAAQRIEQGAGIVEASLEAGFGDLSNFYRIFKRHEGVTPGQVAGRTAAAANPRQS